MSSGLTFDFNYTYSKSIDVGSNAERINEFEGGGFASQIINAWSPNQLRAVFRTSTTSPDQCKLGLRLTRRPRQAIRRKYGYRDERDRWRMAVRRFVAVVQRLPVYG